MNSPDASKRDWLKQRKLTDFSFDSVAHHCVPKCTILNQSFVAPNITKHTPDHAAYYDFKLPDEHVSEQQNWSYKLGAARLPRSINLLQNVQYFSFCAA